jgi:FkbM family methyltransferase
MIYPNDIVVDAGAWIGDVSAYAAQKGATVYAFELSNIMRQFLNNTVELNGNIIVVPYGLSDANKTVALDISDHTGYSCKIAEDTNGKNNY